MAGSSPPVVRRAIIGDEEEVEDLNNVLIEDVTDCSDDCEVFDLDGPDSAAPGEYKEMVSHTITDNDQGIALAPNYESLDIDE